MSEVREAISCVRRCQEAKTRPELSLVSGLSTMEVAGHLDSSRSKGTWGRWSLEWV